MEAKNKAKIIRSATIPSSLSIFCKNMLKELSEKYDVIAVSSPGEHLDLIREREGVRTVAILMARQIAPISDIKSLYKLYRLFKKEKPTMVHSMTPKAGLLCMMAARLARVPVRVHTFTGLLFPTAKGIKRQILEFTDRLTCACATHILPEGVGVKNDLINNHITQKPMKVLGYGNVRGVDMVTYSRRSEVMQLAERIREKSPNSFVFVFVGRIVRDKGINELCSAIDKLSLVRDVKLYLVGKYEENLDPISERAHEIIVKNPAVEFVGTKYGDDLLAYYAASDCFVFPSYREGFPNTVLEAGAMGLPSIVTDINGAREIIIDGVNGTIIPTHNEDSLYNAMLYMTDNNEACNRMASRAREMIASRFEQGYVRKCLYEFYDEILEQYV